MLNGVDAAVRTLVNPASCATSVNRAGPACAPSARPTACDCDAGVQIIDEAA